MKKLLLIVIILLISFLLIFYFKPMTFKLLNKTARFIKKDQDYKLKIDNKLFSNCIYKSTESFNKKTHCNFLILYFKNLKVKTNYKVIAVNIDEKVVGYYCSASDCYDQIFGNLIQSDMGSFYTLLEDNVKGPGFNTRLKIENKNIDFYIPSEENKELHIQLSKK